MRTTLNLPDDLVARAKLLALRQGSNLTAVIVDAMSARLNSLEVARVLPVSRSGGGLVDGVSWNDLVAADGMDDTYR